MNSMSTFDEMVKKINTMMTEAVKSSADAETAEKILNRLFGTTEKPAEHPDSDGESGGKKERKRVVSKKMKESFMSLDGATEEKLTEAIKAYKEATEVDSFDALARQMLGVVVEEKVEKKKKVKAEKKGRFDSWNPTATKLFKSIVEESGGVLNDEIKSGFKTYVEGLDDGTFASLSIQGHMRAYVSEKTASSSSGGASSSSVDSGARDAFEHDGETLYRSSCGKIYRRTEECGDVLVGESGKGRFKSI